MKSFVSLAAVVVVAAALSGCALTAPNYTPSMDNVAALNSMGDVKAKVGEFTAPVGASTPAALSIRGSSMSSPVGGNYGAYVAEALRQELSLANKLAVGSDTLVTGSLVKNELDGSGFSTGTASISARFVVSKGGVSVYEGVKTVDHSWESSFIGATAIPAAVTGYHNTVQKLLASLYADPEFAKAIK
jgi:predicted small lipoprotein YifL